MMNKYGKFTSLALLMSASTFGWSMQQMDDQSLSEQTGQDGVRVALSFPNSTISYNQAIITDKDGFTGSTGNASLVIAPTTYSSVQGIRMFNTNNFLITTNNLALAPLTLDIDADANGSAPVLNTRIALPTDLKRLRFNPFSVYVASGSSSIFSSRKTDTLTNNTYRSGVTELVRINGQGLDVVFADNNPVAMNVQLGNAPQGHMLQFVGGSILCMANNSKCLTNVDATTAALVNPIEIVSKNGAATSSVKLDFKLNATDQTTGFRLAGFYGDIKSNGIEFGKTGITDKFDLEVTNVIAGCNTGCSDANTFNGLKNGSIGNFGAIGASVTDLKINVKGM